MAEHTSSTDLLVRSTKTFLLMSIWPVYRALAEDSGNPRTSMYHVTVTFCTAFGSCPNASWAFAQSRAIVGLSELAFKLSELTTVRTFGLSESPEFDAAAMVQSGPELVVPVVLVLLAHLLRVWVCIN